METAKPGAEAYAWFEYTGPRTVLLYSIRGVEKEAVLQKGERFGVRAGKKGRRLVLENPGTEVVFAITPELEKRLYKYRRGSDA